jgi:hypothetical protein
MVFKINSSILEDKALASAGAFLLSESYKNVNQK